MQLQYLLPRTARDQSVYAPPDEAEAFEIKCQYLSGESLRHIADDLKIGWQRVRKTLITAGIYETPLTVKINNLYAAGNDVHKIAQQLKMNPRVVHSYLPYREPQRYDVPLNQLTKAFDRFIEAALDDGRTFGTVASYKTAYACYAKRYDTLTIGNMQDFKEHCYATYEPSTAAGYCSGMNQFCHFAGLDEFCVKVDRFKRIETPENVITEKQYAGLCNGLLADGNVRGYFIVLWIGHLGVRPNDLLLLEKPCLDALYQDVISKGMRRRIYIPESLARKSRGYFATVDNNLLFPNLHGHKMTVQGLNSRLKDWGSTYGIPAKVLYPYSFRHFFARQFLANNGSLLLLSDLMGHWNINTTRIYCRGTLAEQLTELDTTIQNW